MRFIRRVRSTHQATVHDFASVYKWSIEYPELFWSEVWHFCEVKAQREWSEILENGKHMPGARWFKGAQLNFAENLLRDANDSPAIIFTNESGSRRELTRRALRQEVARVAAGLRAVGITTGDRVAGYLPNLPETVIAMLAAASLGAIWSSCSADFGAAGIVDRFGQIAPKVLFTADGYVYGGKHIDSLATVKTVLEQISSIQHVIVVPYLNAHPDLSALRNAALFDAFGEPDAPLQFAYGPFDQPLYILYSSGTTGAPKCIVHGAGGTLLQLLKEHVLHVDIKPETRLFYFTTCGWMMWNWLVNALAAGATIVLYEGSPLHPDARALWRMAAQEKIHVFGASPRFVAACERANVSPGSEFDLSALQTMLSTGSPLPAESFHYLYRAVKADLLVGSISGGTDIVSCFALAAPILPVYEGEIQCRGLGMKVEIYDDDGRPIEQRKGELVCTAPFPSMPCGFWNDVDGSRYQAAYFARFPNVWRHGDYALLSEHGGVIIYGRSDAVLNPGGVRIGTAEIYRQVAKLDEVVESMAIGQQWENDVRVILFVKLRESLVLDATLEKKIKTVIRKNTTARHVPARIVQVPDLPRTLTGKLVELAVRNIVHGEPVKNTEALANPESLDHFRDLPELHS